MHVYRFHPSGRARLSFSIRSTEVRGCLCRDEPPNLTSTPRSLPRAWMRRTNSLPLTLQVSDKNVRLATKIGDNGGSRECVVDVQPRIRCLQRKTWAAHHQLRVSCATAVRCLRLTDRFDSSLDRLEGGKLRQVLGRGQVCDATVSRKPELRLVLGRRAVCGLDFGAEVAW